MKAPLLRFVPLVLVVASRVLAQEAVIDSMDAPTFKFTKDTGKIELVDGKDGKALQFTFPQPSTSVFAARNVKPTPEWDQAAGFSFWVKGDGASQFGGLQLIWNNDFAAR